MNKTQAMHSYGILPLVLIALLISCGTQRTFQTNAPAEGFAKYIIVEIPDFKTSLGHVPPEAVWKIPNDIASDLEKEKLYTGVSRSLVDISERVLTMEGTIVKFDPPTWYEQAVKTIEIEVNVRFIDKTDSRIIAEANFEAISKVGAASGGVPFTYYRLVDEIVRYVKSNYATSGGQY